MSVLILKCRHSQIPHDECIKTDLKILNYNRITRTLTDQKWIAIYKMSECSLTSVDLLKPWTGHDDSRRYMILLTWVSLFVCQSSCCEYMQITFYLIFSVMQIPTVRRVKATAISSRKQSKLYLPQAENSLSYR